MKRFFFLILCACTCATLMASTDTIRILGIGNSFTMDAMEDHLQPIMSSINQPATMAYPYRGGTTLKQHDSWKERTDTMPYNYYEWYKEEFFVGGDRSSNLTLSVEKRPWDYIIIQTDHAQAGLYKSYDPYLTNIIRFIKTHCSNKDVKIGLYMTWAYDSISTYSGFSKYKYNTQIMYDSIINAVSTVMQNHKDDIDFLIPVGTAIQNARTSFKGHTMNRDGYHLNYDHGRYIASLAWASVICGFDPDSVPFYPENISEYCANMCRAAVKGAIKLPYDTTSLRKDFGKSESGSDAADESRLGRVTFNGLSVPIIEGQYEYTVNINTALAGKVTMYSFPLSTKAEQNITDEAGADIKRDTKKYGYFPLTAPTLGQTVTYTNRVIAEDLKHTTTYTFHLVGATEQDLVYTISSLDDLKDFAQAVNGGQYSLKAELTHDINLDIQKQDCWKTPIGTIYHPYTGTFDGKGYMLENFNIYSNGDSALWQMTSLGLFGAIKGATIKNLTLTSREHDECYFTKPDNGVTNLKACGVLVGWMANSTISRCNLDVNVYSTMKCPTGAMVGLENDSAGRSVIDGCEVKGIWRARQTSYYAAYVGQANNVAISNSSSHVRMPLETNHSAHIAGFIGLAKPSSSTMIALRNCYFAGYIKDEREAKGVTTSNTAYLASFISEAQGANTFMDNCYYLYESAPKVVAKKSSMTYVPTATSFVEADLTNTNLASKLGRAFVQGAASPIPGEAERALVEKFSKYDNEGWDKSAIKQVRNGDLVDWNVNYARRASKDTLSNGEKATWLQGRSNIKNQNGDIYIQTKDSLEGGIKSVSFIWNKFENDTVEVQLTVSAGSKKETVTRKNVTHKTRYPIDFLFSHKFAVKENTTLMISNSGAKTVHVGDIYITPYIGFAQKSMRVSFPEVYQTPFAISDFINNTDGEGIITFSSSDSAIAVVDSLGMVTVKAQSDTPVMIKATWEPTPGAKLVTATYQLIVDKRTKRLAKFDKQEVIVEVGKPVDNKLQMNSLSIDIPVDPVITYTFSNPSVAVVEGKQIKAVGVGTTTVWAKIAESDLFFADSTSYTLQTTYTPTPDTYLVETFSECAPMDTAKTIGILGDNGVFKWQLTNFKNTDKVKGQRGIRVRYEGSIASEGELEGGVKTIFFDWRAAGLQTVHYTVSAGKVIDDYRHDALDSTSMLCLYAHEFGVKSNTTIKIALGKKEKPQQTFPIIGPVKIVPYLFYTVKDTTIKAGDYMLSGTTFVNDMLINNTNGEGKISYRLLGDNAGQIAEVDADGQITILGEGSVTVQASWEGVTTTYRLNITLEDPQLVFNEQMVTRSVDDCTYTQTVSKMTEAAVIYSFDGDHGSATIDPATGEVRFSEPGWLTIVASVPAKAPYGVGEANYMLIVEGGAALPVVKQNEWSDKRIINHELLIMHDSKCFDAQGRER